MRIAPESLFCDFSPFQPEFERQLDAVKLKDKDTTDVDGLRFYASWPRRDHCSVAEVKVMINHACSP